MKPNSSTVFLRACGHTLLFMWALLLASGAALAQSADLAVTKSVSNATPNVGDTITFTVTLTDNGPNPATNVTVQDLLPAGLVFVSATPSQGTYDNTTGLWNIGTVIPLTPQTLSIQATVVSAGARTNTATISHSDQFDPDSGNNSASATETPQQSDLTLSKTPSTVTPASGSNFSWTVTGSNNGPDTATNVTVQDALPVGVTFVSATPSQGTYNSVTGVWTIGTIASGANATLTLTVTAGSPGTVTNTATVSHSDQFDPNTANNSASSAVTIQSGSPADLRLTKTVSNATPNVGDTLTFTVTLQNLGPGAAAGVSVTDLLPAGLTFVSATPSQGSYNSSTGLWSVGSVANAATATLAISATVVSASPRTNTATISASDAPDPVSANNSASATETPQQSDLTLSKAASTATAASGANFGWTVTVSNNGPNAATNVTVQDVLPAGVTFVSATPSQGTYNSGTGVWTIGTIASGVNATLTLTVTAGSPGTVTNTASVSHSDQFDPNAANNAGSSAVTIASAQADLGLSKTASTTTPASGANFTWTVTLSNSGPNAATNVTVQDALPAGVTFVSATPSQGTYNSATGVWTIGTIASGANATLTLTVTAGSSGTVTNTASVSHSDQFDPNTANNAASSAVSVPSGQAVDIPALSPFMLLMLAALVVALGAMRVRA